MKCAKLKQLNIRSETYNFVAVICLIREKQLTRIFALSHWAEVNYRGLRLIGPLET